MTFIRGYYRLSRAGLALSVCDVFRLSTSYLPLVIKNVPLSFRIAQLLTHALLWILNVRVTCPEKEKLRSFAQFVKQFGYSLNLKSRKSITSSMNNLLGAVKGKDIEDIVINLSIRSMAKAVYDTTNIGDRKASCRERV